MILDGVKLREARERAGLTQEELAGRIGVTEATINRLERGHQQPRITTARKLAEALNTTIGALGVWTKEQDVK